MSYPPHERRSLEALGIQTSYYMAGRPDQPPLIFLHGMSASADSFREIMHELAADYWLVAPDIPGFGYTDNTRPYTVPHLTEWLAGFRMRLGAGPATLVGHSFGGTLAAAFAAAYPRDVTGMVLFAPSLLQPEAYPQWLRNLARHDFSEKILGLGVGASRLTLQRQMRSAFYDAAPFPDSLWERRAVDYRMARASAAVLRASALHDSRADLAALTQPVTLIWGESDPVTDPAQGEELVDLLAHTDVSLHVLDRCGHLPLIERREPVLRHMRTFLEMMAT